MGRVKIGEYVGVNGSGVSAVSVGGTLQDAPRPVGQLATDCESCPILPASAEVSSVVVPSHCGVRMEVLPFFHYCIPCGASWAIVHPFERSPR